MEYSDLEEYIKVIFSISFVIICSSNLYSLEIKQTNRYYIAIAKSGLILRDKPSVSSEKLVIIPYNSVITVVNYANIQTTIENKTDYWYFIDYNNNRGWAFGGFVSNDNNVNVINKYLDYLSTLNGNDVSSVKLAMDYLVDGVSGKDDMATDFYLREFMKFYLSVLNNASYGFSTNMIFQKALFIKTNQDKTIVSELSNYRNDGIAFYCSEGEWDLAIDQEVVVSMASKYTSPYAKFLKYYYSEDRRWIDDDEVCISWIELGNRIAFWEKFAEDNPNLLETKTIVDPVLNKYVSVFTGNFTLDNTPIISRNGALMPDVENAYKMFMKNHPTSKYYQQVEKAYDDHHSNSRSDNK